MTTQNKNSFPLNLSNARDYGLYCQTKNITIKTLITLFKKHNLENRSFPPSKRFSKRQRDFLVSIYLEVQKYLRSPNSSSSFEQIYEISLSRCEKDIKAGYHGITAYKLPTLSTKKGTQYLPPFTKRFSNSSPDILNEYNYNDYAMIPNITVNMETAPFTVCSHAFERLVQRAGVRVNHAIHFAASSIESQITKDHKGDPWLYIFDSNSLEPLGAALLHKVKCQPSELTGEKPQDVWSAKTFYDFGMLAFSGDKNKNGNVVLKDKPKAPSHFVEYVLSTEDVVFYDYLISDNNAEITSYTPNHFKGWIEEGYTNYCWPLYHEIFFECAQNFGNKSKQFVTKKWLQGCLKRSEVSGEVWYNICKSLCNLGEGERGAVIIGPDIKWCEKTGSLRREWEVFTGNQKKDMQKYLSSLQISPTGRKAKKLFSLLAKTAPDDEWGVAIVSGKPGELFCWNIDWFSVTKRIFLGGSMQFKKYIRNKKLKLKG